MDYSDKSLIEEILKGSNFAYNTLMQRYDKHVYRVAYKHTGNIDDALDVTQDVFLKIYCKLNSFSGNSSFKAWLTRIAHNEAMDWLRKNCRMRGQEELNDSNMTRLNAVGDNELEQRQFKQIIEKMLPKLNDNQRIAVSLRFFEDRSLKEIANVIGCSEGNVKNILFRAMDKLRNQWVIKQRVNYEQL